MLYKRIIDLRRSDNALTSGAYQSLDAPEGVFAYERGGRYTVALNFTGEAKRLDFGGEIVISTELDREGIVETLDLRPNEGVILRRG